MFTTDTTLAFLTMIGLWLLFTLISNLLFKLSGQARNIYVGIITFVFISVGLGDISPGIIGYMSASSYLQFRPFLYALVLLFASTSITAYIVTTDQDKDKGPAAELTWLGSGGLLLIAFWIGFHTLQELDLSLRVKIYPAMGVVIGVGIVSNLILGLALGRLPGGWVYSGSVVLNDSQKVSGNTVWAAVVGFIAGFIGFTVGSMIGTQIVSWLGWAEGAENARLIFMQNTSYGSDIAILGGLYAAVVALKGKEGTGSEGWASGLKAGVMMVGFAVLVIVATAIPSGGSPLQTEEDASNAPVIEVSTPTSAPSFKLTRDTTTQAHSLDKSLKDRIVFVSNRGFNYDVYVMNSDGSDVTNLTNSNGSEMFPYWSPDGTRIAFDRRDDLFTSHVFVMDADGRNITQVTDNQTYASAPAWSPDGTKIAFLSSLSNPQIYAINLNGNNQTMLIENAFIATRPAWSPNGNQIAYRSGNVYSSDLYVMDIRTGAVTRLTRNEKQVWDPSWSPDGAHIAFSSSQEGNIEIYTMNADGTNMIRITDNPADDLTPTWSPDSKQIAFSSDRDGNFEIYLMNADGTGLTRLTYNSDWDSQPNWQP